MVPHTSKNVLTGRVSVLLLALTLLLAWTMNSLAADITGTVTETMDAAGYTYMNLDTGDKKIWVAIPQTEVAEGEKVSAVEGMEMKDFSHQTGAKSFNLGYLCPASEEKSSNEKLLKLVGQSFKIVKTRKRVLAYWKQEKKIQIVQEVKMYGFPPFSPKMGRM